MEGTEYAKKQVDSGLSGDRVRVDGTWTGERRTEEG
jgi:hypothetical protein